MVRRRIVRAREGLKMALAQLIPPIKKKRIISRRTNKLTNMTKQDLKEMNEVSGCSRGLSNITLKMIYGDDK